VFIFSAGVNLGLGACAASELDCGLVKMTVLVTDDAVTSL